MITFTPYFSGSKGNLYLVTAGSMKILLECGVSKSDILKCDFRLSDIDACFISHEHKDHAKAWETMLKHGVTIFTTNGTAKAAGIRKYCGLQYYEPARVFAPDVSITAIPLHHDAMEPAGCIIKNGTDSLLYATDTYYLDDVVNGLTHIAIECNHSYKTLQDHAAGDAVAMKLADRIAHSHMALETLLDWLEACDLSKCREIWLCHMSDTNGDAEGFKQAVQKATGLPTFVAPAARW